MENQPERNSQSETHTEKLLCSELVELRWHRQSGDTVTLMANLEEIWREGATLELEQAIPEKSLLEVVRPPATLRAEVLYRRDNGTGFTIGIRFNAGSEWSTDLFLPGHALDPEILKQRVAGGEKPAPRSKAKGAASSARRALRAGAEAAAQAVEQGSLYCLGVRAGAK